MLGHHLHLDRVAQVGLVAAIPQQAVAIGDQRPIGIHGLVGRKFLEQPLNHRLHGGENVCLFDKRHLDIQLIKIGGRAVGARVFIAETGRDLEIAVKAADHDQLLELLRRLRQRIELARMQARRHQKIARAFGAAGGDDRGLKFVEPLIPHPVADRAHHVGAQHHVLMQLVAAQIEKTIGQAGFFGIIHLAKHRHRQFIRSSQHGKAAGINLDLAGRDLGVHQRRIACLDHAINADHPFGPHRFQAP